MKVAYISRTLAFSTLMASSLTYAEDFSSKFSLSPMVGHYFSGNDRGIEDTDFVSLGISYEFDDGWAVEASYLTGDTNVSSSPIDVDIKAIRIDALYHFSKERLRPYALFGFGNHEFEGLNDDQNESIINIGGGIKYAFNRYIDLRVDARTAYSFEVNDADVLASIGLAFKLGHRYSKPVATTPIDSDSDGVLDNIDQCPNTTANVEVDSRGCALPVDSDGDGVNDDIDQCPDSASGSEVDEKGCYVELEEEVSISLDVKFATNSDSVLSSSYTEIERVADFMKRYPTTNAVIEGHTDDSGSASYNRQLSERRAQSVAKILVENYGIRTDRISTVGYGEDRPIVANDSAENRALNRRVVAVIKTIVKGN